MPVGVDTTNDPVLLDVPLTLEELEGLDVPDAPVLLVFAIEDAFEEALPEPAGALLQDANRQNAIVAATTMTRCFFIGSLLLVSCGDFNLLESRVAVFLTFCSDLELQAALSQIHATRLSRRPL